MNINLARKPFINRKPVIRVSVILWLLAFLMTFFNVSLYLKYMEGFSKRFEEAAILKDKIEKDRETIRELSDRLSKMRLKKLNKKVKFINSLIRQRTLKWTAIFSKLGEILPVEVRLVSLSPRVKSSRQYAKMKHLEEISLGLVGVAKGSESLYKFLDSLYKDPHFFNPSLQGESTQQDGVVFNMNTIFVLPQGGIDGEK